MKKLLLAAIFTSLVISAQTQSRWNIGVGTGCVTNISKYDSGNEEANALFSSNPYHSNNVGISFRYSICEKMSFQTGINYAEIGYSYSIAKDYSLLKPRCNKDDINSSTIMANIPAMLVVNTPVNCSNVRFIFGAGVSARIVDNSWDSKSVGEIKSYEASNFGDTYITANSGTVTTFAPAATWMIGLERVLRKGNSIIFAFQGNQGFTTVSKSTVNYTVANQEYTHTFINRGSFVSFSLAYNFAPIGTRKALKAN